MCVIFAHSKVVKVIPEPWLQNHVGRHTFRSNEIRKIFFSSNHNAIPNFELPLSDIFDESVERCYNGYLLKKNGK